MSSQHLDLIILGLIVPVALGCIPHVIVAAIQSERDEGSFAMDVVAAGGLGMAVALGFYANHPVDWPPASSAEMFVLLAVAGSLFAAVDADLRRRGPVAHSARLAMGMLLTAIAARVAAPEADSPPVIAALTVAAAGTWYSMDRVAAAVVSYWWSGLIAVYSVAITLTLGLTVGMAPMTAALMALSAGLVGLTIATWSGRFRNPSVYSAPLPTAMALVFATVAAWTELGLPPEVLAPLCVAPWLTLAVVRQPLAGPMRRAARLTAMLAPLTIALVLAV